MADLIYDTFTDTNGTLLAAHTGETNASWTAIPDVDWPGNPVTPGAVTILGNSLTIAHDGISVSMLEAFACSGQITSSNFTVELAFTYAVSAGGAIAIYAGGSALGDGSGSPLLTITEDLGLGAIFVADGSQVAYSPGGAWPTGVEVVVQAVVTGLSVELFVNGVSQGTHTNALALTPYLTLEMFTTGFSAPAAGDFNVAYLRVTGDAGPVWFWTNLFGQSESA